MSSVLNMMFAMTLSASNAGWVKHDSVNTFNDVAVTKEQHDAIVAETGSAPFWGNQGPTAVLRTWNSAAFDAEQDVFYFMGGGHSDYGGNEIYTYSINSKRWARLTNPAPLLKPEAHSHKDGITVYLPEASPISTHTYDGMVWNPVTKSIWHSSSLGFGGGSGKPSHYIEDDVMWEFKTKSNQWVKHPARQNAYRAMSVYLPNLNKTMFVHFAGGTGREASLFDANGNEQFLGTIDGLSGIGGVSMLFSNTDTNQIYTATTAGIYEIIIDDDEVYAVKATDYPSVEDSHFTSHMGQAAYNYRAVDQKFYIWAGGRKVMTWDPASNEFDVVWNEDADLAPEHHAKGDDKVFEKFVYVEEEDYFVGVQFGGDAEGSDGVWVWHPTNNGNDINKLDVAEPTTDGQTQTSISVFLPLNKGDKNFNSQVSMQYRLRGTSEWQQGMDLFRVRPDLVRNTKNTTGISGKGFAGMVTGLQSNRQYEFNFTYSDPDGIIGNTSSSMIAATTSIHAPADDATVVNVSNQAQFEDALENALPGQIIKLAPGTYAPVRIRVGGVEGNHVYIHGSEDGDAVIDAQGGDYGLKIETSYLEVAHLTITNAQRGIRFIKSRTNVVVHSNLLANIERGIEAKEGQQNVYIHDNTLRGMHEFGNISSETWSDEGIVVTGNSVEVSYNTLSGFGDSIGLHWQSGGVPNRAINIHHNLVEWGGDDGIEFDFTQRNVAAHHNMVINSANGLSFQPVWGGPAIAFRNVIVNTARGPLKIKPEKNDPAGMLVFNNTFVKGKSDVDNGEAWKNNSGTVSQLSIVNNLFISGVSDSGYTLINNSRHHYLTMDHNGWSADGKFKFNLASTGEDVLATTFAEWKKESGLGENDVMLNSGVAFNTSFKAAATLDTFFFEEKQSQDEVNIELNDQSPAIDAGKVISGFTHRFEGEAPDIGAIERGTDMPAYGARHVSDYEVETLYVYEDTSITKVVMPQELIEGSRNRDTINMTAASNAVALFGLGGHDILTGSAYNDVINGGIGSDVMNGGKGDDIFMLTEDNNGTDTIDGGEGYDVIVGNEQDNVFTLRVVRNVERIEGQLGNNVIMGNKYRQNFNFTNTELVNISMIKLEAGHDYFTGSKGDDHVEGGAGNDFIDGHDGFDTAYFQGNVSDYTISINGNNNVSIVSATEGRDTLRNVESFRFANGTYTLTQLRNL